MIKSLEPDPVGFNQDLSHLKAECSMLSIDIKRVWDLMSRLCLVKKTLESPDQG